MSYPLSNELGLAFALRTVLFRSVSYFNWYSSSCNMCEASSINSIQKKKKK